MKKLMTAIAATAFVLGTVACGGADKAAKDASDADESSEPQKGLEKFEGNKMEKADEEE